MSNQLYQIIPILHSFYMWLIVSFAVNSQCKLLVSEIARAILTRKLLLQL
jgi:predicted nucleic acid-binding protein